MEWQRITLDCWWYGLNSHYFTTQGEGYHFIIVPTSLQLVLLWRNYMIYKCIYVYEIKKNENVFIHCDLNVLFYF